MTRATVNQMVRGTETYDTLIGNTLSGTGSPAMLANLPNTRIWQVLIQAHPDNASNVSVGFQTNQPIILSPEAAVTIPIDSTTKVYVNCAVGDSVGWLAMG